MSEDPKPPYVQFEVRAVEDRTASEEAGHYVAKDVVFAIVTPAGTKDRLEKVASDWIAGLEEGVKQERIPTSWLRAYKHALGEFEKSGDAAALDGTPIRTWPVVQPSQAKLLLDLNIYTVEQLAELTEEGLNALGMGARALKAKAVAWLDSAGDQGKLSAELANLRLQVETLSARDKTREEELQLLKAENEKLAKVAAK